MSSGYYSYAPPKPTFTEICQQNIDRLNKEKENLSILYRETLEEIESVRETINRAKNQVVNKGYLSESSSIDGLVSLVATETHSGANLEELFFADIEVSTGKMTIVAIDFSEQISLKNAINSTEYKKMALSSKVIKKLLSYCYSNNNERDVEDLINTINKMLDDKSVGYDYFADYILERFDALQKRSSKDSRISDDKWELYCSLCALVGNKPIQVSFEEIDKEIDNLSARVFQKKYMVKARRALRETFEELGLQVSDDYDLESITGSIVTDKENGDYQLFLSSDEESFALEMIETNDSNKSQLLQQSLCGKRKKIYEIMARKGYPLSISAESDESASKQKAYENKRSQESSLERLKKRRLINGRTGKARAIGA